MGEEADSERFDDEAMRRDGRPAVTAMLSETTLWQRDLASLIRSGLFAGAEAID